MKNVNNITRKELLELPRQKEDSDCLYNSIIVVKTRKMHDSGYNIMVIVGVINHIPTEIISYCDHIWFRDIGDSNINIDCLPTSNCTRIFPLHGKKLEVFGCSSVFVSVK